MKIVTIAALGLASALTLLPASAIAKDTGPAVHVSYADLNLRTEAGVSALDRRLAEAVRTVCSDRAADTQLARQLSVKRCISVTKAELTVQRERVLAGAGAPALLAGRGR